ncbi:methylase [Sphaeroforma arctica JP610]|uniref:Methylase n=1 Tax=Sphaeroforma arctica JP610 TaxID=667725 RepID=A0A0L0GA20_9EUKA|nr:methylase [Sphaeroforma arctica JP610]KNC85726.1 methylase [Sphaeroforma arctica JP610]|eukprot:XP_014159628.1 methylase [Sphaeroforma arctica JP610]
MLPTPDVGHLKRQDFDFVYEPAEDTFLFLDALEKDRGYLLERSPKIGLEVGSGSGTVITFLATVLGKSELAYFATDLNDKAAAATYTTGRRNNVAVEVLRTDLLDGVLDRLGGQVDVLLFNPPYVPTPPEEVGSTGIEASWAGGKDGREVTDRLLPLVPRLLSETGVFYLVVLPENKPDEITEILEKLGLCCMCEVLTRKSGPERLSILRYTRQ